GVSTQGTNFPPGIDVPDLDGAVKAAGGQVPAVGVKGNGFDPVGVPAKSGDLAARRGIPDAHRPVTPGRGETPTVPGASRSTGRVGRASVRVFREGEGFGVDGDIPDTDRAVAAGGGQAAAVGTEGHTVDRAGVPDEREQLLAGCGVPDLYLPRLGGALDR